MRIRGMFVKLCAPLDDEGSAGGNGGPDLESMGSEISESLFGGDTPDNSGEGSNEVNLDSVGDPSDAGDASVADPAPADTPAAPVVPPAGAVQPPRTWRPEAAATWAAIPPEAQAEILKREDDIFRGLEGYKADAGIGKALKDVVGPYLPLMQQHGVEPMAQISGLLKAHSTLVTASPEAKAQMFRELASSYGVDLDSGEAPYVDPQVQSLQKQLSDLQSRITGRETQEAETVRANLKQEIDTFASDPAHPYFDEVSNDITALLKGGGAKNLADAYEKAIWANPVTRAKEQARVTTEATAKAQAEAKAKVAAAKKATSANVKSSAKPARGTAALGSIEDTLTEALGNIRSRA